MASSSPSTAAARSISPPSLAVNSDSSSSSGHTLSRKPPSVASWDDHSALRIGSDPAHFGSTSESVAVTAATAASSSSKGMFSPSSAAAAAASGSSSSRVMLHPGADLSDDIHSIALDGIESSMYPPQADADAATTAATASHDVHYSSINSSVFVLAATTLGAGILALPYAMATLGWLFGSLLLICIALASSYSIRLLLQTAQQVGATTYEELGHAIFPRFGRRLVVTCTLVLIFGSLTAFFVIIADTFTPAFQNIVANSSSFFTHRAVLLCIIALLVVYPLCLLKSIHSLERWSFLAVGIILIFSIVVLVESIRAWVNRQAAPDKNGALPSISAHFKYIILSVETFEAIRECTQSSSERKHR